MSFRPEVEEEYKEAFSLFDKDNDGKLSRAEFIKIIENLGIEGARKKAEAMLGEVGAGDFINFETFRQMFIIRCKLPFKRKEIEDAFSAFDVDKSGKILEQELRQIFTNMNAQIESAELDRLVQDCEPDASGMLDYRKLIHKMFTDCFEA